MNKNSVSAQRVLYLLALCLLILTAQSCRASIEAGRIKGIKIDGDLADWSAYASYDKDGLSVSAGYDAEKLYLSFRTRDMRKAAMLSGLTGRGGTVWFSGGGMPKGSGLRSVYRKSPDEPTEDRGKPVNGRRLGIGLAERIDSRRIAFFLIDSSEGRHSETALDAAAGYEAAVSVKDGAFCYEISVPFAAAGVKAGGKITVNCKAGNEDERGMPDKPGLQGNHGGIRPPGEGKNGRAGRGGMEGGARGGQSQEGPIDITLSVYLR